MTSRGTHTDVRRTRAWRRLVQWAKLNLPWVCHLCGQPIPVHVHRFHPLGFALDHLLTVRDHPELALSKDNVLPSHKRCNDWRKARPLTLGLRLEAAQLFAVKTPMALDFFGESAPPPNNVQSSTPGGGVGSPEPETAPRPSFRPSSHSDYTE